MATFLSKISRTDIYALTEEIKRHRDMDEVEPDPPPVTDGDKGRRFMKCGNLAVVAGRMAIGCRQNSKNRAERQQEEPGVNEDDKIAATIIAFGEDQTSQHLLSVNR